FHLKNASGAVCAATHGRKKAGMKNPFPHLELEESQFTSMSPEPVCRSSSTPPLPTLPCTWCFPRLPCMVTGRFTLRSPDEVLASMLNEVEAGTFSSIFPDPALARQSLVGSPSTCMSPLPVSTFNPPLTPRTFTLPE